MAWEREQASYLMIAVVNAVVNLCLRKEADK
jgi:hypothetical protein